MQIHTRYQGQTLWQGLDAEGRKAWAITDDRDGVAVEPSSLPYTSKRAAVEDVRPIPRKEGRPPVENPRDGNPMIRCRLPEEVAEWVASQPGGAREILLDAYRGRK